jgi:hypothetical protein
MPVRLVGDAGAALAAGTAQDANIARAVQIVGPAEDARTPLAALTAWAARTVTGAAI